MRTGGILFAAGLVCVPALPACGDNAAALTTATLSGNWGYTCAIDEAAALRCWGALSASAGVGGLGEPTPVPTVIVPGRFRAVSAGTGHACAIADDGGLWCWGRNYAGQLGDGTQVDHLQPVQVGAAHDWQAVTVGGGHSCGLRPGGALWCWGGQDFGGSGTSATFVDHPIRIDGSWREVSAHWYHICARRDDATLWCWKDVDLPTTTQPFEAPTQIGSATWRTMAVGVDLVVGVQDDGSLWIDDLSADGMLTRVGTDTDWAAVAASYHQCALKTDGTLWCWGRDDAGQIGNGERTGAVSAPTQVGADHDWVAITAAAADSCGRRASGQVFCWGSNALGQLGTGDRPYRPSPARVGADSDWASVTVGFNFTCGRRGDQVSCWGSNGSAALGSTTAGDQLDPFAVPGQFTAIEAGTFHMCGLTSTRQLRCWGEGATEPENVLSAVPFAKLGTGQGRTCAITETGALYCWSNEFRPGEVPLPLAAAGPWTVEASSERHSCAIDAAGKLLCWGANESGELGVGDTGYRPDPTPVVLPAGVTAWLAVAASDDSSGGGPGSYSCAISDDGGHGRLYCWGSQASGRLGNALDDDAIISTPTQVGSDDTWVQVSAGSTRACALRSDASLRCWGENDDGGLGIGSADADFHLPTRVGADQAWTGVAVGLHTCATAADGALWCWGFGPAGQLGDGTAWSLTPSLVVL